MTNPVTFERSDNIATITMDDGKANAYGPDMIAALSGAFDRAEKEAKVIILKGREGILSAGFDLKVMKQGPEAAQTMIAAGAALLARIYLHPQPVITVTAGHAIAAGAIMLLASDVRLGAKGAFSIGLNEVSIGMSLPPFGVELARDRLIPAAFTSAVLGATLYGPDEAVTAGYLDQAVDLEELDEQAQKIAAHYGALDGPSFAATKINMRQATADKIAASLQDFKL